MYTLLLTVLMTMDIIIIIMSMSSVYIECKVAETALSTLVVNIAVFDKVQKLAMLCVGSRRSLGSAFQAVG